MRFPPPNLQINFALKLQALRSSALQDALLTTVGRLPITQLDRELAALAPPEDIAALAGKGLRGELLFATPSVLTTEPRLLGYYRLLLGYSQKDFYTGAKGFGAALFRGMEVAGRLSPRAESRVPELCEALCRSASELLSGIAGLDFKASDLADFTLLTLGPQFRGGANNTIGSGGVREIATLIRAMVTHSVQADAGKLLTLRNAAGRSVLIEFGADPDVTIRQMLPSGDPLNLLAIEIKAGTDRSNLYNRLGEAEKSHITAKAVGFTECWTIVNVSRFDAAAAGQKSPSTNKFFLLADLLAAQGPAFEAFREGIVARTGISDPTG